MVSSDTEKLKVRLASKLLDKLESKYKIKLDDRKNRIDINVKNIDVGKAQTQDALYVILSLPQKFLAGLEISAFASVLTIRSVEIGLMEFSGRVKSVQISDFHGHLELDSSYNMEITCGDLHGQIDVNQISAASVIHIPSGTGYFAKVKGRSNHLMQGAVMKMNKSKLWTRNFTIITITNLFMFFAFQLFPSALPPYLKSLGASDHLLGWLQGIMTIATLLIRPFAGLALDRYGRKGIFIAGLVGMLLTTAAYRFFPVIGIIFIIRFVHGMMWGVSNTACSTIATDNIEKSRFAESMGYFSLASSIAMAVAPAVALSLGMQNNILLALAFLSVAFILAFLMKYQKPQMEQPKKRMAPYAKESILPSAIMLLFTITYGAILTFIALYAAQKSIEGVGLFFTVYAVAMLVTRPLFGKLIDNKGFGAGIWPGVILVPAALILLSVSNSLVLFLICGSIYGIGIGAAQASLQTMAIVNVPKDRTGAANATFFTGFDGGIGTGAVLAGFISTIFGYDGMFGFTTIFPVLAGILYFVTSRRKRGQSV